MREKLTELALRYEKKAFLEADPSQFMHRYTSPQQQERAAFIAAALSYGSRKQFIPRIDYLLSLDAKREYPLLPDTKDCFYRLHNNRMVNQFISTLNQIEAEYGSLGGMMQAKDIHTGLDAVNCITRYFAEHNASHLIPKDAKSTCKRICMFLRWMVRDNSEVDLGLWSSQIDKRTLIMPMDTHVLQESQKLGLLTSKNANMSAAIKLTNRLREIFPDDPLKADFALFGLGVDETTK